MAKPKSIQKPSAYLTRTIFRFQDPTGWSGEQWRLIAREPINRMAKQFIIRELSALQHFVTSDDKDDERPQKYMDEWDDMFDGGQGFDVWIARMVDDACTLPFGAASEIGRRGEELDWVVHVDGATLMPTYERATPYVQINPDNWEQRVYFRRKQLRRMLIYPRSDIRFKEYQVAPTEASFLEIEALSKIYLYYLQQLTDTPAPGILDVMDMTAEDAEEWASSFRVLLSGIDPIKIPLLTDHTLPAKFIPFGRSPQDLNVVEQFKRFAEMLLAKYGLSIGDLRLFEHEATLAGERVSQLVTERSGIGFWAVKFARYLTLLLPSGLKFQFKQPRPERELIVAQRQQTQMATLQAATGNKQLISVKDAVEEALALELFITEIEPVEEKEEAPPGPGGNGRQPPGMIPEGERPRTQEELDEQADRMLERTAITDAAESKLHEAFTVLFDKLFFLGYIDRETRIAVSGAIGDWLPQLSDQLRDTILAENTEIADADLRLLAKSMQEWVITKAVEGELGEWEPPTPPAAEQFENLMWRVFNATGENVPARFGRDMEGVAAGQVGEVAEESG